MDTRYSRCNFKSGTEEEGEEKEEEEEKKEKRRRKRGGGDVGKKIVNLSLNPNHEKRPLYIGPKYKICINPLTQK